MWEAKVCAIETAGSMLKKITTEIRAALLLIVAEDITALRTLAKNVAKLVYGSDGKHQNIICQNKRKP